MNATHNHCKDLCLNTHHQEMSRLPPQRGRIQRNRRPDYAFVNPTNLRPYTASYDELRRLENWFWNVHDRALTWRDPLRAEARTNDGAAAHSHTRAVAQIDERAKAPWDNDKTVEAVELDDVKEIPTLELLRISAHHVNAKHKRYWELLNNVKPSPFEYNSPERHGTTVLEREIALHRFICNHANDIGFMRNDIERNARAKARLNRRNRSCGSRHKNWVDINREALRVLTHRGTHDRIVKEMSQRLEKGHSKLTNEPEDRANSSAAAQKGETSAAPRRYSLQYAHDVQRIEHEIEAEEMGVRKPTVLEKTIANRTRLYQEGKFAEVAELDEHMDRKRKSKNGKSIAKRKRKQNVKACRQAMDAQNEPMSDNDDADNAVASRRYTRMSDHSSLFAVNFNKFVSC